MVGGGLGLAVGVLVVAAALAGATVLRAGESWKSIPLDLLCMAGFWKSFLGRLELTLEQSVSSEPILQVKHGAVVVLALAVVQSVVMGFTAAANLGRLNPH